MLELGRERSEIEVVADRIGSPTWARDVAAAIASCISQLTYRGDDTHSFGTYHYTNSGVASWYDFAVAIFEEARHLTPLAIERVRPIPSIRG